jgi:hypothetical protein
MLKIDTLVSCFPFLLVSLYNRIETNFYSRLLIELSPTKDELRPDTKMFLPYFSDGKMMKWVSIGNFKT